MSDNQSDMDLDEDDFRLTRTMPFKPIVGPGTYTPNYNATEKVAPKITFSRQHRFLPHKIGFISARHQSDLLCSASQGPKYLIKKDITKRRAPAYSWGPPKNAYEKEKIKSIPIANTSADVGPAAYKPQYKAVTPRSRGARFSRAERFPKRNAFFNNHLSIKDEGNATPGAYNPRDVTLRKSPRFSFGRKRAKNSRQPQVTSDRSSFLSQSIRGANCRPATLECNIGPGDYNPNYSLINRKPPSHSYPKKPARFLRSGAQFISSAHSAALVGQSGPGPKYYNRRGDISYTPRTPRTSGLKWIP